MQRQPTLPTFGEIVPGEGGRLVGIMRGAVINGVRQPDYALIAPDVPAVILEWGAYGKQLVFADSLTDGLSNTQAMLKAQCPPAMLCADLEIDGHNDFYLPARAEMWAARANTPELFEKAFHWTSTQLSSYYAFVQDFEHGTSHWGSKDYGYRVRPFRRIQLYHFNA
jgi:hypothetical protein